MRKKSIDQIVDLQKLLFVCDCRREYVETVVGNLNNAVAALVYKHRHKIRLKDFSDLYIVIFWRIEREGLVKISLELNFNISIRRG